MVLVGLNTVTYVQKEKIPDNESNPNRSTYNVGATGTRAFYDFLAESGFKVSRWRDPISELKSFDEEVVGTFVVVGRVRREFTDDEITSLLGWVSSGGRLVIIDRDPPLNLIATTANYSIELEDGDKSMSDSEKETMMSRTNPSNRDQMTAETEAVRPLQPTVFTRDINAVQPSKFASSIKFTRFTEIDSDKVTRKDTVDMESPITVEESEYPETDRPVDTDNKTEQVPDELIDISPLAAPVAHLANDKRTLLVDFPFDAGQVVLLTDPYVVANGGILLVDNIQIAANIVGSRPGVIAFDEFHQGYGNDKNLFLAYFSDTPMATIFIQLLAIIGLILFSQSRRFGRPLPLDEPNRLSRLEYVTAMAGLQRRTKAFDLAIENIYFDFRRRVSIFLGVDNHTTSKEALSVLIADRTRYTPKEIEELLFKCEDIAYGEPTGEKEIIALVRKLRQVEKELGLEHRKRKR